MKPFSAPNKFSGILLLVLFAVSNACSWQGEMLTSMPKEVVKLKSGEITASYTYVCSPAHSPLINKQKDVGGTVDIFTIPAGPDIPNGGNYVVTVSANENWVIKSLQMFVGNKEDLPMAGSGYPILDLFPVNVILSNGETSFSYEFDAHPTSTVQIVALHAYLKRVSKNGNAVQTEEFWIEGDQFTSQKWGSYYNYNLMPCSMGAPN